MATTASSDVATEEGATAVVTHRVRDDRHPEYEDWMKEIGPLCLAAPGNLDLHIVRPVPGLTDTFTIIIRFDTTSHLRQWLESPTRRRLIDKASPLLVAGDDFYISSGLDFWFQPQQAHAKIPIRWKQFLVTWSAIYPLVLLVPLAVVPVLRYLGLPEYHYIDVAVITGIVVSLMVYIVMPRYTRLIHRWLYK
jgi:antibiotic biosynthesis monooxygenase (ABM) superfamily enzyme